jgi:AcrR family transcriptional regulator
LVVKSVSEQRKGARRRGRPSLSLGGDNPEARARISEAAIELFSVKGFHGVGVAEIGALANLGAGALYYHIGSKQDLLWEILRVHVEEALVTAKTVSASNLRPEEKLRQLVQEHVRIIADRRREVAIYICEMGNS